MFGRISERYDLLNTVMSGGRHHSWRRIASQLVTSDQQGPALDVATGTGDFALDLARRVGEGTITPFLGRGREETILQFRRVGLGTIPYLGWWWWDGGQT